MRKIGKWKNDGDKNMANLHIWIKIFYMILQGEERTKMKKGQNDDKKMKRWWNDDAWLNIDN